MNRITLNMKFILPIVIELVIGLDCAGPVSTSDPVTYNDMVREVFPSATETVKILSGEDTKTSERIGKSIVSEIRGPSHPLGYLVESQVSGRSGPFKIAVLLDEKLIIRRATVISYPWQRGRGVGRSTFTRQFEGKGPEDDIEIGKDIDAVTGATISCRAMASGVREAVKLLEHRHPI